MPVLQAARKRLAALLAEKVAVTESSAHVVSLEVYTKRNRDIPGLRRGIPGNLGPRAKSVSQERFTRDSETEEIGSCGSTPGVAPIRSVHTAQPEIFWKRGIEPKLTELKALVQSPPEQEKIQQPPHQAT